MTEYLCIPILLLISYWFLLLTRYYASKAFKVYSSFSPNIKYRKMESFSDIIKIIKTSNNQLNDEYFLAYRNIARISFALWFIFFALSIYCTRIL
jgi:hypothetical protein